MKKLLVLLLIPTYAVSQSDTVWKNISRANRRVNSKMVRNLTAETNARKSLTAQPTNGDQERYADLRGSYGKGLKQLDSGFIDPVAYQQLVVALQRGNSNDFLKITMGTDPVERRMHSPQAAFNFSLMGSDGWIHSINPPPTLASAEKAGEMVELYWQALLRDVAFLDYDTDADVADAVADLNALSDFRGPKENGLVTPQTLFRANIPGVLVGPYISQLLLLPVPFSDTTFDQRYSVPLATNDAQIAANSFMTEFDEWHFIQKGHNPTRSITFDGTARYFRNIRDIGNFVHSDPPQLPYLYALLIILKFGESAWDKSNPYIDNPTQEAFVDFFKPQFASLISYAVESALKTAWYQKWVVHRTIRPEFYGFLVNQQITGQFDAGLHSDVIESQAVSRIFTLNQTINTTLMINGNQGTYFLPQAFPEGSPIHPSYPAGHATVGGAAATMLKAFFNEDFVIPNPVVPNAAGTALVAYTGGSLTLGGEINKIAANIAYGRNMAGVHYRCDAQDSLKLGEAVAISILEDLAYLIHIDFKGFSLTKFDGTKITIGAKKNINLLG